MTKKEFRRTVTIVLIVLAVASVVLLLLQQPEPTYEQVVAARERAARWKELVFWTGVAIIVLFLLAIFAAIFSAVAYIRHRVSQVHANEEGIFPVLKIVVRKGVGLLLYDPNRQIAGSNIVDLSTGSVSSFIPKDATVADQLQVAHDAAAAQVMSAATPKKLPSPHPYVPVDPLTRLRRALYGSVVPLITAPSNEHSRGVPYQAPPIEEAAGDDRDDILTGWRSSDTETV